MATKEKSKLHLVTGKGGAPAGEAAALKAARAAADDLIARMSPELDALSPTAAARAYREMGIELPDRPTSADFGRAWAALKLRIAKSYEVECIVEAATGLEGEAAFALAESALASHAQLPKAQARIAELEKVMHGHALDGMIAQAKQAKKLTPAMERALRDCFASGDMTFNGAVRYIESLGVIPALASAKLHDAAPLSVSGEYRWNGKTWAELRPVERADLKREDPGLYAEMAARARNAER